MTAGQYAEQYLAAGFSVIPIRADGSKSPAIQAWDAYKKRLASLDELRDMFSDPTYGVAIIGGEVSGNLGVVDVEYEDVWDDFFLLLREELGVVAAQLPVVLTPGKDATRRGRHLFFRSMVKVGTRKLARISEAEALERTGDKKKTTAIEIKAEGGYVLAPGCPAGCHPSGRLYERGNDVPLELVPVLDDEQVRTIINCARVLDRNDKVRVETGGDQESNDIPAEGEIVDGLRPGDEFKRLTSWEEILEPHGWRVTHRRGKATYWRRPGKDAGISATTGHCTNEASGELLYVFSTNAEPFTDGRAYSKFAAWGLLEHGGDWSKAAQELAQRGYGEPKKPTAKKGKAAGKEKGKAAAEPEPEFAEEQIQPPPLESSVVRQGFPIHTLPKPLALYCEQIAESLSCPVDFPAIAMLGISSIALGASRAVHITDDWHEYARLYMALVADPGSAKSPAFGKISAPLHKRQHELHKEWKAKIENYDIDLATWEMQKKIATKNRMPIPEKPERPAYRHLYTTDPTAEAIVQMHSENPRGFGLISDEGSGWMLSMNQYKKGKGNDRQLWLSMWDGQQQKSDRKGNRDTGPLIASKPFISVVCGIQPDMVGELCDERGREDGFVHRFLFSFPANCKWSEDYHLAPPEESKILWGNTVAKLLAHEMVPTDDGVRPFFIFLSDKADDIATEWWKQHAQSYNSTDFNSMLVGPWSKMRAYIWRIALVLHSLREATGEAEGNEIDGDTMLKACAILEYFKNHAMLLYPRLRQRMEDRLAERAITFIRRKGGTATARELLNAKIVTRQSTGEELLKDLQDRGLGRIEKMKPKAGKGWVHNRFVAFGSEILSAESAESFTE